MLRNKFRSSSILRDINQMRGSEVIDDGGLCADVAGSGCGHHDLVN